MTIDSDEDERLRADPEQDWDRNISASLSKLAAGRRSDVPVLDEATDALPELEQTRELPRIERPDASAAGRQRGLLIALAVLGFGLVGYAAWPWVADALAPDAAEPLASAAAPPAVRAAPVPTAPADEVLEPALVSGAGTGTRPNPSALPPQAAADLPASSADAERIAALTAALDAERAGAEAARAQVASLEAEVAALEGRVETLAAELERIRRSAQRAAAAVPDVATVPDETAQAAVAADAPIADGEWTVSLMTLSSRDAAERYRREVEARGWPAEVQEVGTGGGLFRVQTGAFEARNGADAHARAAREALGVDEPWVTRRVRTIAQP